MNSRVQLAAEIFVGLQQDLKEAREVFFGEKGGSAFERGSLIGSRGDQIGIGAADASDKQIAKVANRFATEVLKVTAFFLKAVNERKGAIGRASSNGIYKFFERVFGNDTEKFANFLRRNRVAAIGARLLES